MSTGVPNEQDRSADAVVQVAIRARTLAQVREHGSPLVAQYRHRFGRVLNADNASELFEEYSASPDPSHTGCGRKARRES